VRRTSNLTSIKREDSEKLSSSESLSITLFNALSIAFKVSLFNLTPDAFIFSLIWDGFVAPMIAEETFGFCKTQAIANCPNC
jgi:hypothetical protein